MPAESFIVPELGTSFPNSFAKMLIDYIYLRWSYTTGVLAKPVAMQGQTQELEFRTGMVSDFKSLQITTLQGPTQVKEIIQTGQKRYSMLTMVAVTLRVSLLQRDSPDPILSDMEKEIRRLCGQYQVSNGMTGIKDLIYDGGDRQYMTTDSFDKSDWRSIEKVWMWYEYADVS